MDVDQETTTCQVRLNRRQFLKYIAIISGIAISSLACRITRGAEQIVQTTATVIKTLTPTPHKMSTSEPISTHDNLLLNSFKILLAQRIPEAFEPTLNTDNIDINYLIPRSDFQIQIAKDAQNKIVLRRELPVNEFTSMVLGIDRITNIMYHFTVVEGKLLIHTEQLIILGSSQNDNTLIAHIINFGGTLGTFKKLMDIKENELFPNDKSIFSKIDDHKASINTPEQTFIFVDGKLKSLEEMESYLR